MEVIFSPTVPKIQPNLWLDSNSVLHAPTNNGWKEISNGEKGGSNNDTMIVNLDNVLNGKAVKADASLYKQFKPILLSKDPVKVCNCKVIGLFNSSMEGYLYNAAYAEYMNTLASYEENTYYSNSFYGWSLSYYAEIEHPLHALDFDFSYLYQSVALDTTGEAVVFTDDQLDVLYKLQTQAVELSIEGISIEPGAVLYSTTGVDEENECSDNAFYEIRVVSDDNFEVEGQPYAYKYKFIVDIYVPEEPADAKGKKEQTREAEDKQCCIIKDVVKTDTPVLIDGVLQLSLEDAKKLIGIWGEYSRNSDE